jgi:hypothetical protein
MLKRKMRSLEERTSRASPSRPKEQLSFDVCRKCRNSGGAFGDIDDFGVTDEWEWDEYGSVICKDGHMINRPSKTSSVFHKPPKWCPFKLEHAVATTIQG